MTAKETPTPEGDDTSIAPKEPDEKRSGDLVNVEPQEAGEIIALEERPTAWLPQPKSFDEAMKFAEMIASSTAIPDSFRGKPGDILIAVQMGVDVGLSWAQALQNIAVINGRACMWGDAVLATVRASGRLASIDETMSGAISDKASEATLTATCVVRRKQGETVSRSFSLRDAHQAGLWPNKGPWKQYPARMCQMRARSWALRDAFPDVLKGLAIREEIIDTVIEGEIVGDTGTITSEIGERITKAASDTGKEDEKNKPDPDDLAEKIKIMSLGDESRAIAEEINRLGAADKRRIGRLFSERCEALRNGAEE